MSDRSDWGDIPYLFSRHRPVFIRSMGIPMACLQSSGNGLYLVWSASMDRRWVISIIRCFLARIWLKHADASYQANALR